MQNSKHAKFKNAQFNKCKIYQMQNLTHAQIKKMENYIHTQSRQITFFSRK